MDFDGTFPSAPVRYAFDNDDSDVEIEEQQEIKATPPVNVEVSQPLPSSITLVVGTSGSGSAYLDALEGNTQVAGHIDDHVLLHVKDGIYCLSFKAPVSREQVQAVIRPVLGLAKLEKLVILDDIPIVDYISNLRDIVPPFLRILQSSTAKPVELTTLEPPNMTQDLTAALLTHCEIHAVPCYALFSLQESYLGRPLVSSETLDAYIGGLNKVGLGHLRYDKSKVRVEAQPNNRLYL